MRAWLTMERARRDQSIEVAKTSIMDGMDFAEDCQRIAKAATNNVADFGKNGGRRGSVWHKSEATPVDRAPKGQAFAKHGAGTFLKIYPLSEVFKRMG